MKVLQAAEVTGQATNGRYSVSTYPQTAKMYISDFVTMQDRKFDMDEDVDGIISHDDSNYDSDKWVPYHPTGFIG